MRIRNIKKEDSEDLFRWRNDLTSRKMFFNEEEISYNNHLEWLKESIANPDRDLYIGELNNNKFGVCRFDYNKLVNTSKISININPCFRRKGLGKEFLKNVIIKYLKKRRCILLAEIKEKNIISKKLFSSVGFEILSKKNQLILMEYNDKLEFKKVDMSDCSILYKLLKERKHNISHIDLPKYENHKNFVKNNPYREWYIIYLLGRVCGTFYIQNDNSIGININEPNESIIYELFEFISNNFSPKKEVSSKIPNYFYVNVANTNKKLIDIINNLGHNQIQVTFKLSR